MPRKKKENEELAVVPTGKTEPEIMEAEAADTLKPETRSIKCADYRIVEAKNDYGEIIDLLNKGYNLVGGPFVRYNTVYQALVGYTTEIMKIDYR
jgi:hypothetical protein